MMKTAKSDYPNLSSDSDLTRNSLICQTKRESLTGSISSRRNSHCSIIQTADHIVLVECKSDPLTNIIHFNQTHIKDIADYVTLDDDKDSHSPISSPSSSTCHDLDTNIRQMEETQERIQSTLANLWKMRDNDNPVELNIDMMNIYDDNKRGKRGMSMISQKLSGKVKERTYVDNWHSLDTLTSKNKDVDLAGSHTAKDSKDTSSIDSGIA